MEVKLDFSRIRERVAKPPLVSISLYAGTSVAPCYTCKVCGSGGKGQQIQAPQQEILLTVIPHESPCDCDVI